MQRNDCWQIIAVLENHNERTVLRTKMKLAIFLSLISASAAINAGHGADVAPLILQQSIPLPGVKGKFDHVAIDLAGQRVFMAAKANDTLEVVDLKNGSRLRSVAGFHEPQGVLYLPDTKQVVVANGGNGEVQFLDGSSLNVIYRFPFTADADNLRYDAQARRVYVAAQDGVIGPIELNTMEKLPEIKLPGHPEAFAIETGGCRLFVNVPKTDSVFVIDRCKTEIVGQWQLTKAKVNYTMAFDEAHSRLFVGCRNPASVVVLDSNTGREVATFPIGGETDCIFYDGEHQRIYATGAEGTLDVVEQMDSDHYRVLAKFLTAPLARTCLFVPELDRLFVALPRQKDHDAELRVYQARH
jgi:DNA-binding beta-propeller fold protein YncE